MGDVFEEAVRRAVDEMSENLGEPLTVDDLARAAMFSKFHFSRVFQRVTGLSPGRFLSALRLQRAKHLLASTSLPVADITHEVGYNSVGTFSTRFTSAVGVPPTTFRKSGGYVQQIAVDSGPDASKASAKVTGAVRCGEVPAGATFVGLFPQPIPQGRPASYVVMTRPGAFTLDKVPPGTWYLLAHAVPLDPDGTVNPPFAHDQPVYVAQHGPLHIESDQVVSLDDLRLRPICALDPPVLLALLDVSKMSATSDSHPFAEAEGDGVSGCGASVKPGRGEADLRLVTCGSGIPVQPPSWRQRPAAGDDSGRRTHPPAA